MERLTEREQEILTILRQDPMIAQEELAEKLGITRSAAAVHISNLIRKGYILGRGYVFNEKTGVVVIGRCQVVITGTNTGDVDRITIQPGGWGLELSRELALANLPTVLLAAIGRDPEGDSLLQLLTKTGVNTNHLIRNLQADTVKKMILTTAQGQSCTLTDTGIEEFLTPEYLHHKISLLTMAAWLAVDGGLAGATVRKSLDLAAQLELSCLLTLDDSDQDGLIGELRAPVSVLITNLPVLARLSRQVIRDPDEAQAVAGQFIGRQAATVVVNCGSQGLVLVNAGERTHLPLPPAKTTGQEESRFSPAGLLYGLISGYSLRQAARIAMGGSAGGWTGKIPGLRTTVRHPAGEA